jgi:uncharacterized protein YabN with tetrapyrrole methylase and pyrophosphatase domain
MDIKEFKELYNNDEEIKKFIDSVADQRVNQYRDRFIEKDLPGLVEKQVQERIERDQQERQRLEREEGFRSQIAKKLESRYIDPRIGIKYFDDLRADSSEEEIELRFKEFDDLQEKTINKVIAERLGGKTPEGGTAPEKPSLENMSYEQILNTVR